MIRNLGEMKALGRQTLNVPTRFDEATAGILTEQYAPNWFLTESSRSLREQGAPSVSTAKFDIFLSRAFKDKAVVIGTYKTLSNLGFRVYVDWIHDRQLDRSKVDATTADLLRQRMRQSNSLLYMATSGADESRWMPWECGYSDGHDRKQPHDGHVAILPVLAQPQALFQGSEYLGLYCWADLAPGAGPRTRARDIHSSQRQASPVRFDPWIGGRRP